MFIDGHSDTETEKLNVFKLLANNSFILPNQLTDFYMRGKLLVKRLKSMKCIEYCYNGKYILPVHVYRGKDLVIHD